NPSVETLLHAFLPHPWVDHTHADAILALTNQPNGEQLVRQALGPRVGIVPYVMPGLRLAKLAAEIFERDPEVEALVLLKHGLFTFGDDARTSYERTIQYVNLAEQFVDTSLGHRSLARSAVRSTTGGTPAVERWSQLAPIVRGLLAQPSGDSDRPWRRMLLDFRTSPEILELLAAPACARLVSEGPLTPDHALRTKAYPLYLPAEDDEIGPFRAQLIEALERYR